MHEKKTFFSLIFEKCVKKSKIIFVKKKHVMFVKNKPLFYTYFFLLVLKIAIFSLVR
jgi:hypothetical protein